LHALRRSVHAEEVGAEDFKDALEESRASVTPDMEREYEQMRKTLKQEAPQRIPIGFRPAAWRRCRKSIHQVGSVWIGKGRLRDEFSTRSSDSAARVPQARMPRRRFSSVDMLQLTRPERGRIVAGIAQGNSPFPYHS